MYMFEVYWNISYINEDDVIIMMNTTSISSNYTTNLTYVFVSLGPVMVSCFIEVEMAFGLSDTAYDSLQLDVLGENAFCLVQ